MDMTVKDYAVTRNKTVQAVYKQMKSPQNAELLENHIIKRVINGKTTTLLDDVAVSVLDEASRQTPSVVIIDGKDQQIEELQRQLTDRTDEVDQLKNQLINLQQTYVNSTVELTQKVLQLTDQVMLLTKDPAPDPAPKKWWQKIF